MASAYSISTVTKEVIIGTPITADSLIADTGLTPTSVFVDFQVLEKNVDKGTITYLITIVENTVA